MSKWLYHTYQSEQEPFLTIPLDDHVFRIPPNEPFEVDNDSNGRKLDNPDFYAFHILNQYGGIYGIVEIESTKTRTGITLSIDKAHEMSVAALLMNRHRHINLWAQEQLATRINKNLPVLPPTGFVAESIRLLNIDLDAVYRIRPVGWDFRPTAPSEAIPALLGPAVGAETSEEVAELRAQVDRLTALVEQLVIAKTTAPKHNPAAVK